VVLILDEVITGFRWSPGGVQQRECVQADLVTLAKILAGGLPGGAVAGRRELLEPIAADPGTGRRVRHEGTFNANPMSAAAGIACLALVADGAAQSQCDALAESLRGKMNGCLARRGIRGVAYGESSRFHLAFDARLTPGEPDSIRRLPADALKGQRRLPIATHLSLALLLNGVQAMSLGGFLSTAHTAKDIDATVEAFDRALTQIGPLASAALPPAPSPKIRAVLKRVLVGTHLDRLVHRRRQASKTR
jgi:glutamate-1-semialdehyde 2,1-aminomutase